MARKDDEFEDETPRKPRRRDDDEFQDRPRRSRRRGDDDDDLPPRKSKSNVAVPMTVGTLMLLCLLTCCGVSLRAFNFVSRTNSKNKANSGPMKFQQEVESAEETQTKKSLTQIGLGMNGYEVRHGGFPTNSYDAGGNPLLSWRVHILPFIDQEPLYKRFKLNEPWDSPNNKLLLNNIPQFYMSPSEALGKKNKGNSTYFRAFSSAGSLMDPKFRKIGRLGVEIGPSYREVDSGWSRIVLVVESGEAVEWTKPDDLSWSGGALLPPLGGEQKNPAKNWMLFGDLSVRAVGKSLTPGQLQAAIVITGRHDFDLP